MRPKTHPHRPITAALALACLASAGLLAACGDEAPDREAGRTSQRDAAAAHQAPWLEVGSPLTPAQWLASRGEAAPRPVGDPEVKRVAQQLVAAHAVYRESERMIANRAAQLSDMLVPLGIRESATAILDDLTQVAGAVGQTEGFGAMSQHYFNLRAASVGRADALATLKARYGPKS